MNMAEHASIEKKIPVVFFSLEMSAQELALRLLCSRARINMGEIRRGYMARKNWPHITSAASEIAEAPLYFDFTTSPSILELRSAARRYAHDLQRKGQTLGLVIIDYLQLITPSGTHKSDSLVQQVTEISRALKGIAREIDVPVLALSQLSRAVEQRGGTPRLSDLRDSGSIEQDADVVIFIHREDKGKDESERTNIAEILVEKHRNGPVGKVELYFNGDKSTFENLEKSSFSDFSPPPPQQSHGDDTW
jgi:replicative DNA helicase